MATETANRSHIGFRGPSSFPLGKHHQNPDPSIYANQLKFNLHSSYSVNSLASNFQKPQPLVVEKLSGFPPSSHPGVQLGGSIPSSPASSVASERLHLAVQLAKVDAKKIWRQQKELAELDKWNEVEEEVGLDKRKVKPTKSVRSSNQNQGKPNVGYVQYKSKKDGVVRRREYHTSPGSEQDVSIAKPGIDSEEKQTREVRRLERQIQNYLQRLDGLIHKGQEVIQKKDKRLHVRRDDKDDLSHLSDEDTDPRQYKRAEEQATRSARVLYVIEKQIHELEDEIRKKGRNMKQTRKSQTLARLAAAQRATVRALRMLINSAPLQPKKSQHYSSIYQALTSLIQQLSLLAIQIEDGGDPDKMRQGTGYHIKERNDPSGSSRKQKFSTIQAQAKSRSAFLQEPAERDPGVPLPHHRGPQPTYRSLVNETLPDDSTLTTDASPERDATLKAGLEALLRAKELEKKSAKPVMKTRSHPPNAKKTALLLPPRLQVKRQKAYSAVQKTVRFPNETAHFTKETTASRLKRVERQKTAAKRELRGQMRDEEKAEGGASRPAVSREADRRSGDEHSEVDHRLQEREIQRQLWLEDESRRKLREVMEIPESLVSQAEKAIKMKLQPLLDQAQAVVENSKTKPVQERFANIASEVTMKENEVLSEMILDDLLSDTAHELQRLERIDEIDGQISYVQDSSTLENILQRLEHFEKEEESIRRRLNHVTYTDTYATTKRRPHDDEREHVFTKDVAEQVATTNPGISNSTRHSTVVRKPGDRHPVSLFLPPNVRESIFSYQERFSEYLKQTNSEGLFDPWQLVERLSDDILDEMISEVANEFSGACDNVVEMIFQSEFMKE
ncbi:protein moonraker-like [Dendronephthya gigantea]|uniref:protein moonraker-like n=1 Tax=Dendronephthya gigantea TaxID=151771 RepID=UPI00106CECBD|nr:protein moonraker-like [Dendronephthya gigantea]XP_028396467.1 protein moonraker-like [Dendronephthya gigantea]XP_028396468.1 protein moonraker-like [Dendronephthya gigantea]